MMRLACPEECAVTLRPAQHPRADLRRAFSRSAQ